jgi:hypothetical protein
VQCATARTIRIILYPCGTVGQSSFFLAQAIERKVTPGMVLVHNCLERSRHDSAYVVHTKIKIESAQDHLFNLAG